jgi:hypothetical protein
VITDVGSVEVDVPRDRDASFAPQIVAKRQRRLGGVDDLVISLVAKGLTTGEVQAHLAEIYGAEVSRDTISTITDRVLDGLAEWQSRPLDPVYAVLFIDVINVKIRDGQVANRPIYVILGVTADGERDILGLWAGEHGDGEGAKSAWGTGGPGGPRAAAHRDHRRRPRRRDRRRNPGQDRHRLDHPAGLRYGPGRQSRSPPSRGPKGRLPRQGQGRDTGSRPAAVRHRRTPPHRNARAICHRTDRPGLAPRPPLLWPRLTGPV